MDFQPYVPGAARKVIEHYLAHYEPMLANLDKELAEIEERIAYWQLPDQDKAYADAQLNELYKRRLETLSSRRNIKAEIACLRRLGHDTRMKTAYRLLVEAIQDLDEEDRDSQIDHFIQAAWSAWQDYRSYREVLQKAKDLKDEITRTARRLAELLYQAAETGLMWPPELFSIRSLLETTDAPPPNEWSWRAVRGLLLGHSRRDLSSQDQESIRNSIQYAWEKAPPLYRLLATVAKAAEQGEIGGIEPFIQAGTDSKKSGIKSDYIRAFGTLLREYSVRVTPKIMRAMADIATVIINQDDVVVTYDDVRKALKAI